MDSDPWADAPPSPRSATPIKGKSGTQSKTGSPLVESHPRQSSFSSPSSPVSPSRHPTETSPPTEQTQALSLGEPSEANQALVQVPESSQSTVANGGEAEDGFDDFDDFDQPAAGPSTSPGVTGGDDAFGDFGDFEEGDFDAVPESRPPFVTEPEVIERPWHALHLRPLPPKSELLGQLQDLLSPILDLDKGDMTDEPPRQTGGLHQILISESSREAYAQLCTPPMLKRLDWTRSRVRREHLISMGVPVNLDEVDSHRLSSLPPLRITTSMGPPPVPRRTSVEKSRYSTQEKGKSREISPANHKSQSSQSVPASAAPNGEHNEKKYGLGVRPILDNSKAEELCGIEEDQLSLMSLDRLKALQAELVDNSANASALLAWLLQYKDAQNQDYTTYNGMISELIANAAKAKSAQNAGSGGVFRRSSARQRPQSSSGTITPGRVGSPAMR